WQAFSKTAVPLRRRTAMKVLAINCGSSSLKFKLFETSLAARASETLGGGLVDRIGSAGTLEFSAARDETLRQTATIADHGEGIRRVLDWLHTSCLLGPDGLAAVGHRVVHGADRFVEPTLID